MDCTHPMPPSFILNSTMAWSPQKKMWKKSRIHQTMVSQRWFFCVLFFFVWTGDGIHEVFSQCHGKTILGWCLDQLGGWFTWQLMGPQVKYNWLLNVTLWDISDLPWWTYGLTIPITLPKNSASIICNPCGMTSQLLQNRSGAGYGFRLKTRINMK